MLKRVLPMLFLFAGAVHAHPRGTWIRHPQADINYFCPINVPTQSCVEIACSYATNIGTCRVYSTMPDVMYIETYYPQPPPNYVVVSPTVTFSSPNLWFFIPQFTIPLPSPQPEVRHRPVRNRPVINRPQSRPHHR